MVIEIDPEHYREEEVTTFNDKGEEITEKVAVPKTATGHKGLDRDLIKKMHTEPYKDWKDEIDLSGVSEKIDPDKSWGYRRIANHFGCSTQNIRHHVKAAEEDKPTKASAKAKKEPAKTPDPKPAEITCTKSDQADYINQALTKNGMPNIGLKLVDAMYSKDIESVFIAEEYIPHGTAVTRAAVSKAFAIDIPSRIAKDKLVGLLNDARENLIYSEE